MARRWLCRWVPWACARQGGAASGGTIMPPFDAHLIEWVQGRVEEINALGEPPRLEDVRTLIAELRARGVEETALELAQNLHELAELHNTQTLARTYAEQSVLLAAFGQDDAAANFARRAEESFARIEQLYEELDAGAPETGELLH